MIEFKQYQKYILHNKTFNTIFSIVVAFLISLFLGTLFYIFGWLNHEWSALLLIALFAFPMIVFIQKNTNYEGAIAYYLCWWDFWHGIIDRKYIKNDYAKKYGIKNWHDYLKEYDIDSCWSYRVNTKYMEHLANSRDSILVKIAEEYTSFQSTLQAETKNFNNRITELERLKNIKEEELANIKFKLQSASAGAQEYELENQRVAKQNDLNGVINQITNLKCDLNELRDKIQQYDVAFVGQKNKIEQDYKMRSNEYARVATRAIEKAGLKYEVDSLVLPAYWINNPIVGKEI